MKMLPLLACLCLILNNGIANHSKVHRGDDLLYIKGFFGPDHQNDSVTLIIWDNFFGEYNKWNAPFREISVKAKRGAFEFRMENIQGPVYFSLGNKRGRANEVISIYDMYLAEPGDSITIVNVGTPETVFYGKGAAKYNCRFQLDRQTLYSHPTLFDSIGQVQVLNSFSKQMTTDIYNIMFADIQGKYGFGNFASGKPTLVVPSGNLALSRWWTRYLVKKEEVMVGPLSKHGLQMIRHIKFGYTGELRDKLIAITLEECILNHAENLDKLLDEALSTVAADYCRKHIKTIAGSRLKGMPAFVGTLFDPKGNKVNLSDFFGKVVFMDFWYTGCSNCRIYYDNVVSKVENKLKHNPEVLFVSVNVDAKKETWLKSLNDTTRRYCAIDAINLNTGGQGVLHDIVRHYNVISYPHPLLIGRNGKIFSTSDQDLRGGGPLQLESTILKALNE